MKKILNVLPLNSVGMWTVWLLTYCIEKSHISFFKEIKVHLPLNKETNLKSSFYMCFQSLDIWNHSQLLQSQFHWKLMAVTNSSFFFHHFNFSYFVVKSLPRINHLCMWFCVVGGAKSRHALWKMHQGQQESHQKNWRWS